MTFSQDFKQNKIVSWDSPVGVLGSRGLLCTQNVSYELSTELPYEWVIIGHMKQRCSIAISFIMREWFNNANYFSPGDEAKTEDFC